MGPSDWNAVGLSVSTTSISKAPVTPLGRLASTVLAVTLSIVMGVALSAMAPRLYRPGARASVGAFAFTLVKAETTAAGSASAKITLSYRWENISPGPVAAFRLPQLRLIRTGETGVPLYPETRDDPRARMANIEPGEVIAGAAVFNLPPQDSGRSYWAVEVGPGSAVISLR
jgi:hypothetical protein